MKLFVDDARPVPAGWVLARTVQEAIRFLREGPVEEVSLDYMIGDSCQDTFAEVAWFITGLPPEKRPRVAYIHTGSFQGSKELRKILEGYVEKIVRV